MAEKETQAPARTKQEAEARQHAERLSTDKVFMPRTDIYETADGLVLLADMPGVDEKGIDITVENDVLTIRGKVQTPNFGGRMLQLAEYEIGDYERAFTISDEIDRDKIEASIHNG